MMPHAAGIMTDGCNHITELTFSHAGIPHLLFLGRVHDARRRGVVALMLIHFVNSPRASLREN